MQDIDTRLLRSFVMVARERSFSAAAALLGCSQGTMSRRILSLETRLGVRLIDRNGGNFRLTSAGQELFQDAHKFVAMHDRLFDLPSTERNAGRVRLGIAEGYVARFLPKILKHACGGRVPVEVDIVCRVAWRLRQEIQARALDLAIATLLDEVPGATVLSRPPMRWVAAEGFALDAAEPVPVAVFPEGCFLRKSALDALEGRAVAYRVALSSPSEAVVHGAVAAGAAISVMPEGSIPAGLAILSHPSILPPLGRAPIQLLERPGRRSAAALTVREKIVSACRAP